MACYLGSFVFSPSLFYPFAFHRRNVSILQKLRWKCTKTWRFGQKKSKKGSVDVSALQYLSIGCCVMEKVANGEYLENIVKNILFKISKYLHLFSLKRVKLNMKNDQFKISKKEMFMILHLPTKRSCAVEKVWMREWFGGKSSAHFHILVERPFLWVLHLTSGKKSVPLIILLCCFKRNVIAQMARTNFQNFFNLTFHFSLMMVKVWKWKKYKNRKIIVWINIMVVQHCSRNVKQAQYMITASPTTEYDFQS